MGLGAAAEAEANFVDVDPELFDSATLLGAAVWVMAGDFRDAVAIREGVGCEAYGWGKAGSMLRRYGLEDRRLWAKPDLVVLPEILDEDAAAVALPLLLLLPLLVVVVVVALPLVERGCKALAPDIVVRAGLLEKILGSLREFDRPGVGGAEDSESRELDLGLLGFVLGFVLGLGLGGREAWGDWVKGMMRWRGLGVGSSSYGEPLDGRGGALRMDDWGLLGREWDRDRDDRRRA